MGSLFDHCRSVLNPSLSGFYQEKLSRLSEALVYLIANTSRAIYVKLGAIRAKDSSENGGDKQ